MISESAYYTATAAAQVLMNQELSIDADGKWGRFTQSTYERISPELRQRVDTAIARLTSGKGAQDLRAFRDQSRNVIPASVVGRDNVRQLVAAIAMELGVPTETALKIAYLESRFDPKAVSPTGAKGVFQLTSIAIKDIATRGGYVVRDPFDPDQNIRGGVTYIKLAARDVGARLDETAKVYMAFNIGPTGAKFVLSGQPEKAAKQIKAQAYGKQGPANYAVNLIAAVQSAPTTA
jgi:soluble lytic murein transglycosylase-like protein